MTAFQPYLNFAGNCRGAFTRYQQIFGGDLVLIPMKDAPSDQPVPDEQADLIMHAALRLDDGVLMASDAPMSEAGRVQGMYVSYGVDDVAEAERIFSALADGGQVTMAMDETFWSPRFGMCVDQFGTPWMISGGEPKPM